MFSRRQRLDQLGLAGEMPRARAESVDRMGHVRANGVERVHFASGIGADFTVTLFSPIAQFADIAQHQHLAPIKACKQVHSGIDGGQSFAEADLRYWALQYARMVSAGGADTLGGNTGSGQSDSQGNWGSDSSATDQSCASTRSMNSDDGSGSDSSSSDSSRSSCSGSSCSGSSCGGGGSD